VAILAAARALLAEQGVEALTMRAVAQRLDVAPNALYSHVPSKTALLDDVLASVQTPAQDIGDPTVGLHQLMTSAYHVLLTHPGLVPLYLARQGARGLNAQRLGDATTTLLVRAGVRGQAAGEALRVLIVYTIGFAAFAARPPTETDDRPLATDELLDNFTNGLRWLLDGILHTAATPHR